MYVIGVVDTTFARVDMATPAINTIRGRLPNSKILRHTVPGIKDIPLAAKKLLGTADACITFGWVGPTQVDKLSYLVTSLAIQMVQIQCEKPIIDVTVHEDEAKSENELYEIAVDRSVKHSLNLITLLTKGYDGLARFAGQGLRQGKKDVGPIKR